MPILLDQYCITMNMTVNRKHSSNNHISYQSESCGFSFNFPPCYQNVQKMQPTNQKIELRCNQCVLKVFISMNVSRSQIMKTHQDNILIVNTKSFIDGSQEGVGEFIKEWPSISISTTPPKSNALFLWTQMENPARGPGCIPLFFTFYMEDEKTNYLTANREKKNPCTQNTKVKYKVVMAQKKNVVMFANCVCIRIYLSTKEIQIQHSSCICWNITAQHETIRGKLTNYD